MKIARLNERPTAWLISQDVQNSSESSFNEKSKNSEVHLQRLIGVDR